MGPFELADLVGNDVNLAVGRSVWEQTFGDPRYAPFVAQQQVVDAGWLGRKTGRGWYAYDGRTTPARTPPKPAGAGAGDLSRRVRRLLRPAGPDRRRRRERRAVRHRPGRRARRCGRLRARRARVRHRTARRRARHRDRRRAATVDGDAVALDWVGDAATATPGLPGTRATPASRAPSTRRSGCSRPRASPSA